MNVGEKLEYRKPSEVLLENAEVNRLTHKDLLDRILLALDCLEDKLPAHVLHVLIDSLEHPYPFPVSPPGRKPES